jgi:probable HAF family extracellular repeat protein
MPMTSSASHSPSTDLQTPVEWPNSSTPTDLGKLPGISSRNLTNTQASAINDSGLIVGFGSGTRKGQTGEHPFTIQNNQVTLLPPASGASGDGEPFAINNCGLIVGEADNGTGPPSAAEWQNGTLKILGALRTGEAAAFAVNSSGQAVGASLVSSDGNLHAVLYANGNVTDLKCPAPVRATPRPTPSTTTELSSVLAATDTPSSTRTARPPI